MISCVINAKDEERWIGQAIMSVSQFVDEVIVADMASSDATAEVAESKGASVISVPDYGYVEPARRAAIDAASNDWILILDADEIIPPTLGAMLVKLANDPSIHAVVGPHINYMMGRRVLHAGWGIEQDRHLRFFDRRFVLIPGELHARIEMCPGAHVVELENRDDLGIVHFNYLDWSHFIQKLDRYTTVEARAAASRELSSTKGVLGDVLREFKRRYFDARGFRDGFQGLTLSVLMAVYKLMVHAKARQLHEVGDAEAIARSYEQVARQVRDSA